MSIDPKKAEGLGYPNAKKVTGGKGSAMHNTANIGFPNSSKPRVNQRFPGRPYTLKAGGGSDCVSPGTRIYWEEIMTECPLPRLSCIPA